MKENETSNFSSSCYTKGYQFKLNYYFILDPRLSKGLYIGMFLAESTPKGANVLVPLNYRQMCPVMKLAEDPQINPEEWHFISGRISFSFSFHSFFFFFFLYS